MFKYIKLIKNIVINYKFSTFEVLLYELIFSIFYKREFNKFKYLNNNVYSDSIPCPFLFLIKIKKFIILNKIEKICDLGSGYGKILYYFGKILKYKIDGVEIDPIIYKFSAVLKNEKINIYNEDIFKFNLKRKNYNLFILNDPLKKKKDLLKLITKINNNFSNIFLIFINLDSGKIQIVKKNLLIINKFSASINKNILFCKNA